MKLPAHIQANSVLVETNVKNLIRFYWALGQDPRGLL